MDQLALWIETASDRVWGLPLIVLLIGTGIYLTLLLKGLQFRTLYRSLWLALVKRKEPGDSEGDITHFQALMTALSATVGTGNIAGVATGIAAGGPGALFWMWMTGLFGMATKYSEALLGVKYRETDAFGTMSGGPMHYITKGMGQKWLGVVFALFAAIAAFGIGNMVQSNSVADSLNHSLNIPYWVSGVILAVATALVILGGIKSIGRVTGFLVPVMIIVYFIGALLIVMLNIGSVPHVLRMVLEGAFSGTAAAGGFLGAAVSAAIRSGVEKGVFSNESGLGSASIAAAAAKTREPVRQALVSMTQTFIDTIVVCSLTGFAILCTGVWQQVDPGTGAAFTGSPLTVRAFELALPFNLGGFIVTFGLLLFAYSTMLGWSYYGEKSLAFLVGGRAVKPYRVIFCVIVGFGAVFKLEVVWNFAACMNGLMAVPNLIALLWLSGIIRRETSRYFDRYQRESVSQPGR
jgi:AGCS family alanine or glycine:cation symporter